MFYFQGINFCYNYKSIVQQTYKTPTYQSIPFSITETRVGRTNLLPLIRYPHPSLKKTKSLSFKPRPYPNGDNRSE